MNISITLSEQEEKIVKKHAKNNNCSVSDFIRNAILEKIENEYDLKCYKKAMHEYKKNPKTYTIEEIKKLEM
jgi:RHH-type rel operon transcriptional repressor/antitoxin RelB